MQILHHCAHDQQAIDSQYSLLIDCGLFQSAETRADERSNAERLAVDFDIARGGALLVPHVHIDRVGRMPYPPGVAQARYLCDFIGGLPPRAPRGRSCRLSSTGQPLDSDIPTSKPGYSAHAYQKGLLDFSTRRGKFAWCSQLARSMRVLYAIAGGPLNLHV